MDGLLNGAFNAFVNFLVFLPGWAVIPVLVGGWGLLLLAAVWFGFGEDIKKVWRRRA